MTSKLKHYAKETLYFIITMTIFANAISLYKSQDLNPSAFDLNSVIVSNDKKPILLHIWATWCPTCKMEAGNIQRISEHFNVITIAVKSGTDKDIQKYMKEHDLNFKVINDGDGTLSAKLHINAFPTTIIYYSNKKSVFSEVGYTSTLGLWLRMLWAGMK